MRVEARGGETGLGAFSKESAARDEEGEDSEGYAAVEESELAPVAVGKVYSLGLWRWWKMLLVWF